MFTATKLKVTLVLKSDELLSLPVPDGKPRVILQIQVADGRTISADVAAKSVRKAQTAIRESGSDGVALILQGNLAVNDMITDAGLSAQPRAKKEAA
jgi:hypothetical protein